MSTDHALVVWITHENGTYHLVDAQVDNATPDVCRIDISQGSSDSVGYRVFGVESRMPGHEAMKPSCNSCGAFA